MHYAPSGSNRRRRRRRGGTVVKFKICVIIKAAYIIT
jgi:hypothetical protein